MINLTLLGSTGSIGQSTLDVVRRNRDRFRIHSLVAGRNLDLLAAQIAEFQPHTAVVADEKNVERLRLLVNGVAPAELRGGPQATLDAAIHPDVDFVMSAIVGVAGLEATFEAVRRRKRIGLANKETLVAGGRLVMSAAREAQTEIIPVDSEHNGAHQCLRAGRRSEVTRLILTASGGPFRNASVEEMAKVSPAQALNHPTWRMGPRITIDSATLMNKGFEVIEACWLFDFPTSQVDVVVHPQSSVHAMIEYNDGSVVAQISATDMRMPIQYALTYPDRGQAPVPRLDWDQPRYWDFHPPDYARFPLLRLAYQAQDAGGSATCTLNAADEVAVEAFLEDRISFPAIAQVVADTLAAVPSRNAASIGELLDIDRESRQTARSLISRNRVQVGLPC